MRVLFNHQDPFILAHGGVQIQIEQTKAALGRADVEVEYLRWWDDSQRGDLIHFFGRPAAAHPDWIHRKGMKLVVTHLMGALGVRPGWKRFLQKVTIKAALRTLPLGLRDRTGWSEWRSADAYVAVTPWEASLMKEVFGAPNGRVHVIPNAVNDCFFEARSAVRSPWLVTSASILPVKRLVETARAAVAAQTPYWVVGRPFSESDAYYQEFRALCHQHPTVLRHDNIMRTQPELAGIYRQARGFVLLSRWESQSLSALEASACACPLLLSDLPWARSTFGDFASYCPLTSSQRTAGFLREFYDQAPQFRPPPAPLRWIDVAQKLKSVYQRLLGEN